MDQAEDVPASVQTTERKFESSYASKRELFEAMGGRISMIPDNGLTPEFIKTSKNRPARKWQHKTFTNIARQDDLELQHWAPEDEPDGHYPFAAYNRHLQPPAFTTAAYLRCLVSKDWSERETRLLFELCRRFNRRFIAVHDRYMHQIEADGLSMKERTVEDLKQRYYDCINKLATDLQSNASCIERAYRFDHEHETNRKKQLDTLHKRSAAEAHEEAELLRQLSRVRQQKADLGIHRDLAAFNAAMAANKNKNKQKKATKSTTKTGTATPTLPKRESARKNVNNAQRVTVLRRSQNMFKEFEKVDHRIQKFIDSKLEGLNIESQISSTKVSDLYNDIRRGLLALGNVTKAMHASREETSALIQRRNELLRQRGLQPPPAPASLVTMRLPAAKRPKTDQQ